MDPDPRGTLDALDGILERVTYANEENGWSVVRLAVVGRRELVTAVGNLMGVQPGESLRLRGRWVTDRSYGEQFRVEGYESVQPATLVGIERYLGSGLVRGIGRVMAKRLVKHFGLETLDVIDQQNARLQEVPGIGRVRSERIQSAWAEQREIRLVMLFLQSNGVTPTLAVKIYKQYGARSVPIVKQDPYRLALDIFGIGFKTADRIAQNLGIDQNSPRRAEAGVVHVLGSLTDQGNVFYPRAALIKEAASVLEVDEAIVNQAISDLSATGHVVVEPDQDPGADAVFPKSLHVAEVGLAGQLTRLLAAPLAPIAIDTERAIAWYEERQCIALADAQRDAVRHAIAPDTEKILVITGGPGTGKTTLVNAIIQILARKGRRILLAAPTGRAAKRLGETTGREARTIHRLLEFDPSTGGFKRNRENPLDADLLIIDEVSMVDTVLAYALLKAVPLACQLVLVGDVDQLPSVGPGRVLGDLIGSGAVPVVRLSQIFRQAERSLIVVNAHRINRGEMPLRDRDREGAAGVRTGATVTAGGAGGDASSQDQPESDASPDFFLIERDEPEDILATVKHLVCERIPSRFGFDPIADVQVLSPMHRGMLGAASLNAELQAALNPAGEAFSRGGKLLRVRDKVMQIRNNYDLDVFNGDLGRVSRIAAEDQSLEVTFDGRAVSYDFSEVDELQLAYACSIHKSQGSEYPCVVIPLHTQHYVLLQRNLLYTAVTRGRRLVVLCGSRRALAIAVKNAETGFRHTRLATRLSARA